MSWYILENSTTADSADVMDNFYHVGQGSITPKASTTMVNVSDTYDIGSSATAWKDLHCAAVELETGIVGQGWTLESEMTLTTTSSSISITGLNGDAVSSYKIILFTMADKVTGSSVYMDINSDSSASYGVQDIDAQGAVVAAHRVTSATSCRLHYFYYLSGNPLGFSITELQTKTGHERLMTTKSLRGALGKAINANNLSANIWSNSTDTITSLTFFSADDFGIDTHIEIWKRG